MTNRKYFISAIILVQLSSLNGFADCKNLFDKEEILEGEVLEASATYMDGEQRNYNDDLFGSSPRLTGAAAQGVQDVTSSLYRSIKENLPSRKSSSVGVATGGLVQALGNRLEGLVSDAFQNVVAFGDEELKVSMSTILGARIKNQPASDNNTSTDLVPVDRSIVDQIPDVDLDPRKGVIKIIKDVKAATGEIANISEELTLANGEGGIGATAKRGLIRVRRMVPGHEGRLQKRKMTSKQVLREIETTIKQEIVRLQRDVDQLGQSYEAKEKLIVGLNVILESLANLKSTLERDLEEVKRESGEFSADYIYLNREYGQVLDLYDSLSTQKKLALTAKELYGKEITQKADAERELVRTRRDSLQALSLALELAMSQRNTAEAAALSSSMRQLANNALQGAARNAVSNAQALARLSNDQTVSTDTFQVIMKALTIMDESEAKKEIEHRKSVQLQIAASETFIKQIERRQEERGNLLGVTQSRLLLEKLEQVDVKIASEQNQDDSIRRQNGQ